MGKIIVGAMVSMDGVMQAPGGPTEDPTKGFKFGGWEMPYFDQAFGEELDRVFKVKFGPAARPARPTRFRRVLALLRRRSHGGIASCSTTSRSTRFRAQARSIRAGRAQCSCATSPT